MCNKYQPNHTHPFPHTAETPPNRFKKNVNSGVFYSCLLHCTEFLFCCDRYGTACPRSDCKFWHKGQELLKEPALDVGDQECRDSPPYYHDFLCKISKENILKSGVPEPDPDPEDP
jgi:hypothetical protein